MYAHVTSAIVGARRGSKATINVTSASRGGLELFYARGGESRGRIAGGEGLTGPARGCALRRIRARAPPARPQDCIIDIRPTPVPLHECTPPVYERGKKVKRVCLKKIIPGRLPLANIRESSLENRTHGARFHVRALWREGFPPLPAPDIDWWFDCPVDSLDRSNRKPTFQATFRCVNGRNGKPPTDCSRSSFLERVEETHRVDYVRRHVRQQSDAPVYPVLVYSRLVYYVCTDSSLAQTSSGSLSFGEAQES
jgi:hypothetical protein